MLYGTTKEFLEVFGLATLEDLPQARELRPAVEPKPRSKVESNDESHSTEKPDSEPGSETRQADDSS